jgi:hypothetical protein
MWQMGTLKNRLLGCILCTCAFYACQNNNENKVAGPLPISTDVVKNPKSAAEHADYGAQAEFFFTEEQHDFGHIVAGEKVSYAFKFKNVGNTNLLIASASGSCGCTVPEWPKEPVGPGKEGVINVIFNSEGKFGTQHKTVTLTANTIPNTKVLTITGEVEQKKQ